MHDPKYLSLKCNYGREGGIWQSTGIDKDSLFHLSWESSEKLVQVSEWMEGWMGGCLEWTGGQEDDWVDGWVDVWIDGWVCGWTERWLMDDCRAEPFDLWNPGAVSVVDSSVTEFDIGPSAHIWRIISVCGKPPKLRTSHTLSLNGVSEASCPPVLKSLRWVAYHPTKSFNHCNLFTGPQSCPLSVCDGMISVELIKPSQDWLLDWGEIQDKYRTPMDLTSLTLWKLHWLQATLGHCCRDTVCPSPWLHSPLAGTPICLLPWLHSLLQAEGGPITLRPQLYPLSSCTDTYHPVSASLVQVPERSLLEILVGHTPSRPI